MAQPVPRRRGEGRDHVPVRRARPAPGDLHVADEGASLLLPDRAGSKLGGLLPPCEPTRTSTSHCSRAPRTRSCWGRRAPPTFGTGELPSGSSGVVPEARILIVLRDPVDRAYSQYWNDVREGLDRRSFLEALTEEQRSGPGAWGVSSLYIDCGRYADQVARYLDQFGARVQVLFFEDFVRDEAGTIAQIHSFLGVQPAAAGVAPRQAEPHLAAAEHAQRGASRQRRGCAEWSEPRFHDPCGAGCGRLC